MTPAKDEADKLIAVAADAAQAALACIRAMPPGQERGDAGHDFSDTLRAIADGGAAVLHEEIRRTWRDEGGALRPLARRWRVSPTLVVKVTQGITPGRPAPPEEPPEPPAPVVVAVVTSHLGALAGRTRTGNPPRVTFITGDADPDGNPAVAAARTVGEVTGLAVNPVRELTRTAGTGGTPEVIWVACRPASSDTEIGAIDSPGLTDVQWMSLGDVLRYMRGSLPAPVTEHLTRTLES